MIDTAPEGLAEQVAALVNPLPGVVRIDRIRVRPAGKTIFLDLIISIKRHGLYTGRRAGTTKAKPARAKVLHQQGLTVTEIAHALAVSPRTVFRYLAQP